MRSEPSIITGAIMGLTGSELRTLSHSSVWFLLTVLSFSALAAPPDSAEDEVAGRRWHIVPSIEVAETYSDNINLAPAGRKEWDLVTEVTPGLSVHGQSARLKADADYRLQNLLYVHDPSRSTVNNRFKGNASAEVVQDHLFFDTSAVVTQVAIDPSQSSEHDTINSVPRSDVYSLRVGPRYQQNLGGYAKMNAKYSYGIVRYGNGGASDADLSRADLNIGSGRHFTRLGWNLSYYDDRVNRSSKSRIGDVKHQVAVADVSYALTRHFSVIGRAGYEHHEFDTRQQGFENGSYTAAGIQWRPNRHTKIDALYGDRYQSASISWVPTQRTSVRVGWRDTKVGANIGQSWNADMSLRTKRTSWALAYSEQPATVQELVFNQTVFLYYDFATQTYYPDPGPGRVFLGSVDTFTPTDEIFIRKRGQFTFGIRTARTTGAVIIYDEERDFTNSGATETDKGVNTAVDWKFAPRTSWIGNANWSRRKLRTSTSEFDFWRVETGLQEQIGPKTFGLLTVSHGERTSAGRNNGYEENRISVRLNMQF